MGLRVSEALAFATQCRRSGVLRVREQVRRTAHRADCPDRFGPLKHRTPGAYRDVPLPASLEREIDAHLRRWGATLVGGREVLFARRGVAAGTMPTATTYGPDFRRAVRAAGLLGRDRAPRYTPHTLRHFFASTALAHGVPLHEVSRWLGHASIKTTVDIYGHLVPAAWERCWQALEQALGPAPADASAAPWTPTGWPRLLDRRWIRSAESGFAQVTAESSMFRFISSPPPGTAAGL
ncbi:site-specific integrase [Streptomyces sp. CT34]|uniref:site-specific integrase n=1 Tax=Streptomyces sp. CT34 TaxID=1553907 RepID=UPI0007C872EA|nr:site-specific integrase [Streptomyces sp. CT34]